MEKNIVDIINNNQEFLEIYNKQQEIIKWQKNIINGKLDEIVGQKMVNKLSATEMIVIQEEEIERLKKREKECIDHYLVASKYSSELESKIIELNNIIGHALGYIECAKKVDITYVCKILKGSDK